MGKYSCRVWPDTRSKFGMGKGSLFDFLLGAGTKIRVSRAT